MSILAKFSLAVLILIALAVSAVTGLALRAERQALQTEAIERGRAICRNLAAAGAEALLTHDPLTLVNLAVDAKTQNSRVVYAALVDKSGRVASHSSREALGKPLDMGKTQPMEGLADVQAGESGGEAIWDIKSAVLPKGAKEPIGEAHVGLSQSAVLASIRSSMLHLALTSGLMLALGAGLTVLLVGVLVKPLSALSDAAKRVGQGEFGVQVPVPSQDEVGQLMATFNTMSSNLENAQRERLEKERMQGELNVARKIQSDLLPAKAPELKGWQVAFHCTPAKELGGDFFDLFPLDGGKSLGVVIADVSGKGVPAALHMANLRNLTRFSATQGGGPMNVLKRVNAAAFPDLKGESFVTLLYGELNLASRELVFVSAGHDPILWAKKDGKVEGIRAKGMPIGVAEPEDFDFIVAESKVQLNPGDTVFLYTDGVTEAMNAKNVQFGREALDKAVAGGKSAQGTLESVLQAVKRHVAGIEASDDLTALALHAE
jgi:sigma-B regulation protein RsbU (phosphoserine phosphatase)